MSKGWNAELELWFEQNNRVTRLVRRRHVGPLAVQRPFYPERDGSAHVYLLHPPGGVAEGDALSIGCYLGTHAKAVLTTPGATKFYSSDHAKSTQKTLIEIGNAGICEYLPQETILFNGAKASVETLVFLSNDAIYLGWDIVSLGRPACREYFERGEFTQRVEIYRDGRPIWFEQFCLTGGDDAMNALYAFRSHPITATMIYAGPSEENAVERIRAALSKVSAAVFSVSRLDRVIVCRYLGLRMSEAKMLLRQAWEILREAALGKTASAPRIWAT
ncbi:urease accessory protein UreD [Brucella sp. NBRC 12950]|nr:urease accessory protein UreD [Brucella sp. NBRC 12950]GLU28119.1 urease accessory protein UreD [Brucella sp. NBRC 12950]